jgi:hypothetical protein
MHYDFLILSAYIVLGINQGTDYIPNSIQCALFQLVLFQSAEVIFGKNRYPSYD